MNNTGSRLIILLLGDPHLLEGCEGRKDGSTNPYGVLSFWWSNNFNFHGGRSQIGDLLLHPVGNSGVHGGSAGKDSIAVEVTSDVNVALHDGVVSGLMDSSGLHSNEGWLEESLRASESLISNGDDLTNISSILDKCKGTRTNYDKSINNSKATL